MVRNIAALLAVSALAACTPKTDAANTSNTAAAPTMNMSEMGGMAMGNKYKPAPTAGQSLINSVAAADAFEIAISKMALDASQSDQVKNFARQMIQVHEARSEKLKSVIAGMHPPMTADAAFTSAQQKRFDGMAGKTGSDFDAAFASAQVAEHEDALDGLTYFATNGTDWPELKKLAADLAPQAAEHLKMARSLR